MTKLIYIKYFGWLILFAFIFQFSINGQTSKPTENSALKQGSISQNDVAALSLNSKLMAREMPYRVIFPSHYKTQNTKRYSVIYLLHGLTGHFTDWADKTRLTNYAEKYSYIIVMPEGNNGWYSDSDSVPDDRYESYIIKELIPEIDKNFRTVADKNHRAAAGLSMGGYGSIKFGLKYAEMFSLVGSFSGALGAASFTEKEIGTKGAIAESILGVYGKPDSETRKANDIFQMVKEISPERIKSLPFIYLDCGTEDFLYQSNRDFAGLLQEKKIPHEFRELPGIHDWKFWDSQIKEFLLLSGKFVK